MNLVRITMNVISEKKKELVQTILSMNGALKKEAGCMNCTLFVNIEDQNHLTLFEDWKTRKDLDHHLQSEMFGVLLGTKSLLVEPLEIQIFSVSGSEGIEAVNSVRKTKKALIK